jgi:hypothetical protein
VIAKTYRWYKIMSPRIAMRVDGVAVEYEGSGDNVSPEAPPDPQAVGDWGRGQLQAPVAEDRLIRAAYATVRQTFGLWFIPFYRADVRLVCRLTLVYDEDAKKYYVSRQEDCYPVDEAARFVWLGIWRLVVLWQVIATFMCVLLAAVGLPVSWWEEEKQVGDGGELREEGWALKSGEGIELVGDRRHRNGAHEKKKSR